MQENKYILPLPQLEQNIILNVLTHERGSRTHKTSVRRSEMQHKLFNHSLDVILDHSLPILFRPHPLDL